jgi:hypothetical protein
LNLSWWLLAKTLYLPELNARIKALTDAIILMELM